LGVDADASALIVRRAYLRGVKAHPPERDPEGFARLREAFDVARGDVARGEVPADARPDGPGPAGRDDAQPPLDDNLDVAALLVRGQPEALLEVLAQAIDRAERRDTRIVIPSALDVVLELESLGTRDIAQEAMDRFRQHVERIAPLLSNPSDALYYLLVRDLTDLPDKFPFRVRQLLARALLNSTRRWGPTEAERHLHEFAVSEPFLARVALGMLATSSPNLAELFGFWLDVPDTPPSMSDFAFSRAHPLAWDALGSSPQQEASEDEARPRPRRVSRPVVAKKPPVPWTGLFWFAIACGAALLGYLNLSRPPPRSPWDYGGASTLREAPASGLDARLRVHAMTNACSGYQSIACMELRIFDAAIAARDCDASRDALALLRQQAQPRTLLELLDLSVLQMAHDSRCWGDAPGADASSP